MSIVPGRNQRHWRVLGTEISKGADAKQAAVETGLDFEVEKRPVYAFQPDALTGGGYEPIDGQFCIARTDTNAVLGVVGNRYQEIQPAEMFDFAKAMIGTNEVEWDSGLTIQGGKRVLIMARLNRSLYIGGDEIEPFIMLTQGFDGRHTFIVKPMPYRISCTNQLTAAKMRGAFTVGHFKNYDQQFAFAAKGVGLIRKSYQNLADVAEKMLVAKLEASWLEQLVPMPKDPTPRGVTAVQTVRTGIQQALMAPDLANFNDTAWGAYNAVVDYADHMRPIRGTANESEVAAKAFIRSLEDTTLKDRAFALLAPR
jgi:phage/plasmid-like protein (TIGR03299 family)